MIDVDLYHLEAMARAFDYFAHCRDGGERSERMPNRSAPCPADPLPRERALVVALPRPCPAEPGLTSAGGFVQVDAGDALDADRVCNTVLFSHG